MSKEVQYHFALGASLSPSFKSAISGAEGELMGLSARLKELENSNTNKLGANLLRQKENISSYSKELEQAKNQLALLKNQSSGAEKETSVFALRIKQAEQNVKNMENALAKSITQYKSTIATIQNTHGSVKSLSAEYLQLAQNIEKAKKTQNSFSAIHAEREALKQKRSSIQGEIVQTAVPALALSLPVKQAINFEAAMADVAKTMEGMRDDDGNLTQKYYAMEQAVKNMARQIPLSHEEIASLFAAAGQQGLTELSEIENFVTMSAQMAVAFGMSQEQAADAIGGYRAALGLSFDETRTMLDLMNQYANTSSATEQDIANVMRRIGSLGSAAGMSVKPMTALSASLVSMKIPPEEAATGIKNFLLALTSGKAATKTQEAVFARLGFNAVEMAEAMQKDAPKAVLTLLNSLKKLPKAEQLSTLKELFGTDSVAVITPLLEQLDLITKNLEIASDETQYAGAMQNEFENRMKTTKAELQKFSNIVTEASVNIGTALLPTLNEILQTVSPVISAVAEFAKENTWLTKAVIGTAGALLTAKVAVLLTQYAVNGLKTAYTTAKTAVTIFRVLTDKTTYSLIKQKAVMLASATKTKILAGAMKVFNLVVSASPLGRVLQVLTLVTGAMIALYNYCEPVRKAFDSAFSSIASAVSYVWEKIKALWDEIKSIGQAVGLIDEDVEQTITQNIVSSQAPIAPVKPLSQEEVSALFPYHAQVNTATQALQKDFAFQMPENRIPSEQMVFPATTVSNEYFSNQATQNTVLSSNNTTAITIPMEFQIQGLDEKTFQKHIENAKPQFEEIVKDIVEKIQHNNARVSFAN